MFVTVSIRVEPDRALLSIPKEALQLGDIVWVVRDGQLHRQPVEVAMEEVDLAIVEGPGLQAGDQVVISPLASAVDGMQVQVRTE